MNTRELQKCPDTYMPADCPAVCLLESFGLIKVSGEDAGTFLQNLCSNDFAAMQDGATSLGALCNPKGRMLATFRAVRCADAYYLALPREIVDKTIRRLTMFVLAAKVVLEDVSDGMPGIGVIGDAKGADIADVPVIRLDDGLCPRRMIYPQAIDSVWQQLVADGYTPMEPKLWRQCDIRSGFAQALAATDAKLVPQMGNLDLLGGVSFSKGCYPGQEIVARMHYLGNLKKRTYIFSTPDNALATGDEVSRADSATACGTIVDFCAGETISYGLATLAIADHNAPLRATKTDAALTLEPCPYEIRSNSHDPEKAT